MCAQTNFGTSVAITLPTLRAVLEYHAEHASGQDLASFLATVRNAWEAIFVQLPGERDWKRAARLRLRPALPSIKKFQVSFVRRC